MKNVSKIIILILLSFITINVTKAEECYVTNKENVQIPCNFYEGLRAYYSDNFLSYMTSAEYNQIKDNDLDDIETEVYTEGSTRGTYIETSYKQLRITRNGNESMPSPSGGTETGHAGNGYAKVTFGTKTTTPYTNKLNAPTFTETGIVTPSSFFHAAIWRAASSQT